MDAPLLPRAMCCICLSEEVKASETACGVCRGVFTLVDAQVPDLKALPQRVAIGPTDV